MQYANDPLTKYFSSLMVLTDMMLTLLILTHMMLTLLILIDMLLTLLILSMRYCFCLVFFFFFIKLVIGFNKRSAGEDTHIGVMKRDKKNEDDNEKEEYKKNNRFEKVKKKKNYRQKPDYGKEGPPLNEEGKFNDTVIEEKFNKGYNKYKKYFETSDNPEQEKQRRNNFKKNSNSIRVIQLDKSRKFQVDDESVFLFMSEEEKGTFKGLGNITEMESELPVKSIRPAPVSTSNVLSKISNRNNGNSPSKHSNATTVNTGEDVSSLEKREGGFYYIPCIIYIIPCIYLYFIIFPAVVLTLENTSGNQTNVSNILI